MVWRLEALRHGHTARVASSQGWLCRTRRQLFSLRKISTQNNCTDFFWRGGQLVSVASDSARACWLMLVSGFVVLGVTGGPVRPQCCVGLGLLPASPRPLVLEGTFPPPGSRACSPPKHFALDPPRLWRRHGPGK